MKARVESDGDTYPKDVYIVDDEDGGMRFATAVGNTEANMFRAARELCDALNNGEIEKLQLFKTTPRQIKVNGIPDVTFRCDNGWNGVLNYKGVNIP